MRILKKRKEKTVETLGKPGVRQIINEAYRLNKSPWQLMKEEWERRKFERDKKYNK